MKTKIKHMVAASLAMCTLSTGIGGLTSNAIKNTNTDDYYSKDEDVDITLLKYIEDNNIDADLVEFFVMEDQGFNDSEMITNLLQIREMLTGYIKDNDLPARVMSNEEVPDEIAESFVSIEYYYKDENVHITLLKYIEDNNIDADLVEFSVAEIEDEFVKGDINADGKFTVADVVMLQKWLLGTPDATLSNWKSADLCEDGTLNVFDPLYDEERVT